MAFGALIYNDWTNFTYSEVSDMHMADALLSPAGTSFSGVVGAALVAGVAVLICVAGGFFRKRKKAG